MLIGFHWSTSDNRPRYLRSDGAFATRWWWKRDAGRESWLAAAIRGVFTASGARDGLV